MVKIIKDKTQKGSWQIESVHCLLCRRVIDKTKDNYLALNSYNDGELIESALFCLPTCWQDYNQHRVNQRFAETLNKGMSMINSMTRE